MASMASKNRMLRNEYATCNYITFADLVYVVLVYIWSCSRLHYMALHLIMLMKRCIITISLHNIWRSPEKKRGHNKCHRPSNRSATLQSPEHSSCVHFCTHWGGRRSLWRWQQIQICAKQRAQKQLRGLLMASRNNLSKTAGAAIAGCRQWGCVTLQRQGDNDTAM